MQKIYKFRIDAKSVHCHIVSKNTFLTINDNSHEERRENRTLDREFIEKNFCEDHYFYLNPIGVHKSYETNKKYVLCRVLDIDGFTLVDIRHEDMIKLSIKTWVSIVTK